MKKQNATWVVLMLSVSCLLSACHSKKRQTAALEFDSVRVEKTAHLFNDTAKPACNIAINFTYLSHSSDQMLKDTLNAWFTEACFGSKYVGELPDSIVSEYVNDYITQYRHDLEPMYRKDEMANGASEVGNWYAYYKTIKSSVQRCEKDLLVYRIDYHEYTGGAHGMYTTHFINIDVPEMRRLRLENVFVDGSEEALTDLIWNQLMMDNKVTSREELEELGYSSTGEISPSENFYIDDDNITFYYNVYDIAPYVMGPVKVSIPFPMVKKLMAYEY